MLKDGLQASELPVNLIDCFRCILFSAWQCVTKNLGRPQSRRKTVFDCKAEIRIFSQGDQVFLLLPYTMVPQVNEFDYLIATPNQKESSQLCHVNLLKPYYDPSSKSGPVGEGDGSGGGVTCESQGGKLLSASTTKNELRRFLGMIGYYQSFCYNFRICSHALTNLL